MRKPEPRRQVRPPDEHWTGEWVVGAGWARFFGRVGSAQPEACASAQVVTAICTWSRIGTCGGAVKPAAGVIVRHGDTCCIDLERPHVMILFADTRLPLGAAVEQAATALHRLNAARAARWRRALFGLSEEMPAEEVLQRLPVAGGEGEHRLPADKGVAAVLRRWRRAAAFVSRSLDGVPLVEAARLAGFPGTADCTRTFRQLFGLSPTLMGFAHDRSLGGP